MKNIKNNWLVLLLISLLVLPCVFADMKLINTTISIDWIGNDEFYIRTEDLDFLHNSSDQTDKDYDIQFERFFPSGLNETNTDEFISTLNSLNHSINEIIANNNWTELYVEEVAAHERVVINYEDCKEKYSRTDSALTNTTKEKELCFNDRVSYQTTINTLQSELQMKTQNSTRTIADLESKVNNNLLLGLLIGAGGVGLLWFLQKKSKEKKSTLPERKNMGFGG